MLLSNDRFIQVAVIISIAINSVSFLQNLLALVVFSQKAFAKSSFRIYFKSLAVFDMFVVFYVIAGIFSLVYDQDLLNQNDFMCKCIYLVSVGLSPNSGWVLVMFSLDQLNRVTMSKRCVFIRQRKFQLAILAGLFIIHLLNALYIITQVRVKAIPTTSMESTTTNVTFHLKCDYPTAISFLPLFYMLESCVIPLVVMIVTTTLILKVLFQSRAALGRHSESTPVNALAKAEENIGEEEEEQEEEEEKKLDSREENGSKSINNTKTNKSKSSLSSVSQMLQIGVALSNSVNLKKNRNIKFAFNSVVFNIVFVILVTPMTMLHLYRTSNSVRFIRLRYTFFIMMSLNYASHFWIHYLVNSIFRKQLLDFIKFRK